MLDADERDVVDLVHDVVAAAAADRGLELARQVGELRRADEPALDLGDRAERVDDLVGRDPGDGAAEHDPRAVTAGLGRVQTDGLERRQIAGTSSIRIQCSWMFCRSVRSAEPRAYAAETSPMTRSCSEVSAPPSIRTRSMKNSSSSSCGSSVAVRPPSMPGLRWV